MWGGTMKGLGTAAASAAVIMFSGVGGAYAADLGTMPVKAIPVSGPTTCTNIVDFFTTACQLSAYGVRFYGTVDVGLNYMTNGTPIDKLAGPTRAYFPLKNSGANGSTFGLVGNALSISNIGLQINENLGGGWRFVADLETRFSPLSGDILDSSGSVHENAGLSYLQTHVSADGASNGKWYNQFAYAGVSNSTWGTLTFGRQLSIGRDITISYDSMGNALGFSYIGFFGATAGGGDTEQAESTTAVKYKVNIANWRLAALAQIGGYGAGNSSNGYYEASFGADYHVGPGVLSFDALYGFTKDGVSEADNPAAGVLNANGTVGNVNGLLPLTATISNNTAAMIAAKYTLDRLTLYAGYEWIQFAPPSDRDFTSFTDQSGTLIGAGGLGTINFAAFDKGDKIQQTSWVGAKYAITDSLSAMAAFYHADFRVDNNGGVTTCASAGDRSSGNCPGNVNAASAVLDWQFAPKWDTYVGTLYSKFNGSQANGLFADNNWSTTAGIRFRW